MAPESHLVVSVSARRPSSVTSALEYVLVLHICQMLVYICSVSLLFLFFILFFSTSLHSLFIYLFSLHSFFPSFFLPFSLSFFLPLFLSFFPFSSFFHPSFLSFSLNNHSSIYSFIHNLNTYKQCQARKDFANI